MYRACSDMKLFRQEVLRVLLLDARFRQISIVDISKGTINESLAYPREIFRPVILHGAYAFVLVHNHPSGVIPHSVLCRMLRHFVRFFEESDNIPDAA
jgi:DNA repair protein RadC